MRCPRGARVRCPRGARAAAHGAVRRVEMSISRRSARVINQKSPLQRSAPKAYGVKLQLLVSDPPRASRCVSKNEEGSSARSIGRSRPAGRVQSRLSVMRIGAYLAPPPPPQLARRIGFTCVVVHTYMYLRVSQKSSKRHILGADSFD